MRQLFSFEQLNFLTDVTLLFDKDFLTVLKVKLTIFHIKSQIAFLRIKILVTLIPKWYRTLKMVQNGESDCHKKSTFQ